MTRRARNTSRSCRRRSRLSSSRGCMSWTRTRAVASSSARCSRVRVGGARVLFSRRSAALRLWGRCCATGGTRTASRSVFRGRRGVPLSCRSRRRRTIRRRTPGTRCSRCCAALRLNRSTASTRWTPSWLCVAAASKSARRPRHPSKVRRPSWRSWTRRRRGCRRTAGRSWRRPYARMPTNSGASRLRPPTPTRSVSAR